MCDCTDCLQVRAVENLVRMGLAQDYSYGCELLELIVPPLKLSMLEQLRRFKLLDGPHAYTVYKVWEAKQNE